MEWNPINKYAPLVPLACAENADYSIRGEWTLCRDGVMRITYMAYYRRFPIYEIERSSSLAYIKEATEQYIDDAREAGKIA